MITVREWLPADAPLILNSWLRSYAESAFAKPIRRDLYDRYHHAVASRILGRARVTCAVLPDDPSVVLAYVVHEGPVVHYLYVKGAFRRMGIASRLLPEGLRTFTHLSSHNAAKRLITKHGLVYNPYLV